MRRASTRRTVADVMRDAAAVPAQHRPFPKWANFLKQFAVAHLWLQSCRRTVLVLPTGEFAPALLTLVVVERLMAVRTRQPLDVVSGEDVGRSASVFASGCYEDAVIRSVTGTRILINGSSLEKYLDIVRMLPGGFIADRPSRRLERETISVWSRHLPKDVDGARVHARISATPVVVIGNRAPLLNDLGALEGLFPDAVRLCDVGAGPGTWFRHPVICVDPSSQVTDWLQNLRPSLVVAVGASGWRSPVRHALGSAPQILVLDRRSSSCVDVVSDILLTQPRTVETPVPPPHGVEAWTFDEVTLQPPGAGLAGDEGDLF